MSKKRKFKFPTWLVILVVEFIACIILFSCGFKITYAPDLENDWEAVEAVGTWICGLVVPFVLVYFERKLSASEKKIRSSNLATLEELNEFKERYEPLLKAFAEGEFTIDCGDISNSGSSQSIPTHHEIYRFICISMIASSREIATHFGVSIESLQYRLEDMWTVQEIISPATLSDDPNRDFANCRWTKAK